MSREERGPGHIPGLRDVPAGDRRALIEGARRRARLAMAEDGTILAIVAHGEVADRASARDATLEILVIVAHESVDRHGAGADLSRRFEDLPVNVRLEVETHHGFRTRLAAGDPELARIRDRAVLLSGALPVEDGQAW